MGDIDERIVLERSLTPERAFTIGIMFLPAPFTDWRATENISERSSRRTGARRFAGCISRRRRASGARHADGDDVGLDCGGRFGIKTWPLCGTDGYATGAALAYAYLACFVAFGLPADSSRCSRGKSGGAELESRASHYFPQRADCGRRRCDDVLWIPNDVRAVWMDSNYSRCRCRT